MNPLAPEFSTGSRVAQIPPAFKCTSTAQVMDHPVLALCGHLFNRTIVHENENFYCPIDRMAVQERDVVPFEELRVRIDVWRRSEVEREHAASLESEKKSNGSEFSEKTEAEEESEESIKYHRRFQRAHDDDIHGLLKLNENHFLSCSKDNSIKKWTNNGVRLKTLKPSSSTGTYAAWVTALTAFSNGYWVSGTRDGTISFWNKKDREVFNITYSPGRRASSSYQCKDRNKTRINCITELETLKGETTFYTGTPGYIQLWDQNSRQMLDHYRASKNDWVYCIEVLENKDLFVVIGSDLEFWNMQKRPLKREAILIEERDKTAQRPHISSIVRIENDKNQLGCALFDGSVKVVDVTAKSLKHDYREHRGRVWSVINLNSTCIASSADDKMVKVWDLRQNHSAITLKDHPGRVSSLLKIEDNYLVSASCADDPHRSQEKGVLTYWDLRSSRVGLKAT